MSPREEAVQRLKTANAIAILPGPAPSWDVLGASAALARSLRGLGKSVNVLPGFAPASLPDVFPAEDLAADAPPPRDFIVSFDLGRSPIRELRYERDDGRLSIILSPQSGALRREDVEFGYGPTSYDLIVTLGIPELRAIEATAEEAPELLHEKPLLNIDCQPENTRYGDVNVIDTSASSLSEIVFHLVKELGGQPLAPDAATALLAGMAEAVGPLASSLRGLGAVRLVGELLDAGGDALAVARALEARRDPEVIRLLGRALARSRFEPQTGVFQALLTREDFLATGRGPQDTARVLEELERLAPPSKVRVLCWEDPQDGRIRVMVKQNGTLPLGRPGAGLAQPALQGSTFASFAEAEGVIRTLFGAQVQPSSSTGL